MHGIVHQRFKEYVVEGADEASWRAVLERAEIEPTLYLAVSSYPDADFDAALAALSSLSGHDRATIERDFGRYLAPALRSTFSAHAPRDENLSTLLASLEPISTALGGVDATTRPPEIAGEPVDEGVRVTYRSPRGYCSMAHGVLEGLVEAYGAEGSTRKVACVDDGDDACAFLVTLDE